MKTVDQNKLPRKLRLSGSDCFHLVLDLHAQRQGAGSNTMRMVFYLVSYPDPERIRSVFRRSGLLHWMSNIRLHRGIFFSLPAWVYRDKGGEVPLREHLHGIPAEIPREILDRDLPLAENRFLECDLLQYPDKSAALVLSWNHILMDGRGIGLLVQHLNELYAEKDAGSPDNFFPPPEKSAPVFALFRNLFRVRKFIEESSAPPTLSVARGKNYRGAGFRSRVIWFSEGESRAIREAATLHGARFGPNLFYLSSCLHAIFILLRQRNQEGSFWIPIPYDGRLRGSRGPVISNSVAFLFYRISPADLGTLGNTVASLSRQMTEQLREGRPGDYSLLLNLMRRLPIGLYYRLVNRPGEGSLTSFLYSSTGENFNGIQTFLGEQVRALSIFPSPVCPPGLTFSFLQHLDALNVNMVYSPDIVDTFEMNGLEDELRRNLLG
jgi:hypothetical protein